MKTTLKTIENPLRAKRLTLETIGVLDLDLTGMTILTEAASGPFIMTPLIAALAGADRVYAVAKDSAYGSFSEIERYLSDMEAIFGIPPCAVELISDKNAVADQINLVTNLCSVRPIQADFLQRLPKDAAISLMWEAWEARPEDIDFAECGHLGIPVLGTNERDERLNIFHYVGVAAMKLLLECGVELFKARVLVVSSEPFASAIMAELEGVGSDVMLYNPWRGGEGVREFLLTADAVVLAEQTYKDVLIGPDSVHIPTAWLGEAQPAVVHIAGVADDAALASMGLLKRPAGPVPYGHMGVTTGYAGVRPVIELHTAGLKVGQAMVEGRRLYDDVESAVSYALCNSPAMPLTKELLTEGAK